MIFLINNDAFVSAAMADEYFMVPFVCLFMKTHLLALLQDNCLDLVHYKCFLARVVCILSKVRSAVLAILIYQ